MITESTILKKPEIQNEEFSAFRKNKKIPALIERNVLKALSFYPQLKDAEISFEFRRNINSSVMLAQPVFRTLVKRREKRKYRIYISSMFKLKQSSIPIQQLPDEVMIGWIGHELGHIMDYETRPNAGLVIFGISYYLSGAYVKKAEVIADTFAVNHGLGRHIILTKRFILDHAEIPQSYKNKIARLYLSPDVIMEQVRKLEEAQTPIEKI